MMAEWYEEPRLVFRPALAIDTRDVLRFTRLIWDGDDYMPHVWQEWLAAPHAQLFTAEYNGHCVGIARLRELYPGQWWLEGLRVDRDFQDRQIGSRLNDFMVNRWLQTCRGSLRLLTTSTRIKIHHLCERSGFTRISDRWLYIADPCEGEHAFRAVLEADLPAVLEMEQDPVLEETLGGLVDCGYEHARLQLDYLRECLGEGRLWWWRDRRAVLSAWVDEDDKEGRDTLFIGWLAARMGDLTAVLTDLRIQAARQGLQQAGWWVPPEEKVVQAMKAAGFQQGWDQSLYIYEMIHPHG